MKNWVFASSIISMEMGLSTIRQNWVILFLKYTH